MQLHPTTVMGVQPTEELGRAIMALRYDLLAPVLKGMLMEARRQSAADEQLGREKLSYRLHRLGDSLENADTELDHILGYCAEYIKAEKDHMDVQFGSPMYVEKTGERIQFQFEGIDYIVTAPQSGFVIGGKVDENGIASLVYQ